MEARCNYLFRLITPIRGLRTRRVAWHFLLLFFLVSPSVVMALHEADHRFTVTGYVRDDQGQAVDEVRVRVVDTEIGLGATAFTDESGYYEVLLHIHNANLGDDIEIKALDETKRITATFDPEDHESARGAQVDFGAALSSEGETGSSSPWVYALGAAVLVSALLVLKRKSKKKPYAKGSKGPKKK